MTPNGSWWTIAHLSEVDGCVLGWSGEHNHGQVLCQLLSGFHGLGKLCAQTVNSWKKRKWALIFTEILLLFSLLQGLLCEISAHSGHKQETEKCKKGLTTPALSKWHHRTPVTSCPSPQTLSELYGHVWIYRAVCSLSYLSSAESPRVINY